MPEWIQATMVVIIGLAIVWAVSTFVIDPLIDWLRKEPYR